MCGYCKGLEYFCDACYETVSFNENHDNYKKCGNIYQCSNRICPKCSDLYNVSFCEYCVVDDKHLEEQIEVLQTKLSKFVELKEIHEVYNNELKYNK